MRVYLYVLDTMADWEVGYITAELHSGRYLDKTKDVTMTTVGATTEPVTTMGGLRVTPEISCAELQLNAGDLVILPGADTWMDGKQQAILELVEKSLDKQVLVAAICGATMALAAKGILNHRTHTSNAVEILKMSCPGYTGEEYYRDQPAVAEAGLITASGLAPLQFAHAILKTIGVMKPETLEAWYQLHTTRDGQYFFKLMQSMQ